MTDTNVKLVEYIRQSPPDADPHSCAIFFLCQEIDKLKKELEINKKSWPGSPLNSYV